MTNDTHDENEMNTDGEMDFADLLNAYDYDEPSRADLLEGVIMVADENELIVDVGLKRDAFVPREDLGRLEQHVLDELVPGKQVLVYVLRPRDADGNLIVSINKALEQNDWELAQQMEESKEVVDVEIVGYNRGGLLADFGRIRGFIPQSHISLIPRGIDNDTLRQQKEELVGQEVSVVVIEVNRERNRLVLSEREARSAVRKGRIEELTEGQIVTGRVVGLVDYGAFVDIGGIDGLIHISNLDTRYVRHPSDFLEVGDEVTVRIDNIDLDRERINLNRKVLMPDPWETIDEHYQPGNVIDGIVTNIVDFGIFVAMPHGFEGLVHESEMEAYLATNPLSAGDPVTVRIIEIDRDQQRISLSLDAVPGAEEAPQADPDEVFAFDEGLTMDELEAAPAASALDDLSPEDLISPTSDYEEDQRNDWEPGNTATGVEPVS